VIQSSTLIDDLCETVFDRDARCQELRKNGLTEPECQDQIDQELADLRNKVRHERRIELAFEEHRFWDIRRWGIAGDAEVLTIYRVDMDTNGDLIGNGQEIWETRTWNVSNFLLPIPQSDIDKNSNLTQNPGY
jgi:hypothetical protein